MATLSRLPQQAKLGTRPPASISGGHRGVTGRTTRAPSRSNPDYNKLNFQSSAPILDNTLNLGASRPGIYMPPHLRRRPAVCAAAAVFKDATSRPTSPWGPLRPPDPGSEVNFLRNRVREASAAWESAGAGTHELAWIRDGYLLPFIRGPPPPFHQGTSLRHPTPAQAIFLQKELQRWVTSGALEPAESSKFVTKAFLVDKPGVDEDGNKKFRFIVDLQHVNKFLRKLSCRYETLKKLNTMAEKDDYMFSMDLQDGFHAIGIHKDHRKYLTVDIAGFGLFQFCVLPFGLSPSPYAFCKLMRTFVRALRAPLAFRAPSGTQARSASAFARRGLLHLRPRGRRRTDSDFGIDNGTTSATGTTRRPRVLADLRPMYEKVMRRGLRVLSYMDDFAVFCKTKEWALEDRDYCDAVVDLLNLKRNENKGVREPCQLMEHLGLGIDTIKGVFYVTATRLNKLRTASQTIMGRASRSEGLVPKRQLASFTGLAQSLYLAIPLARHYLRSVHDVISTERRWSGMVRLSKQAWADLDWFAQLAERSTQRSIWRSPYSSTLHCDASELAWGGLLNGKPARGFWRPHQQRHHITILEAKAVRFVYEAFREELKGQNIHLWEDNQAVVAILKSWTSRSPELMKELRKLQTLLDVDNSSISATYIRSEDNPADYFTRLEDRGDWRLSRDIFQQIDRAWGPHTVDRFATSNNAQLVRFNSAWADPGTEGVDAFAQRDWESEVNYCNPPWDLLDRLAHLLRSSGAPATVVAPHWPAQPWFQALNSMACDVLHLPPADDLFSPGRLGSFESMGPASWWVTCFRIPARRPTGVCLA